MTTDNKFYPLQKTLGIWFDIDSDPSDGRKYYLDETSTYGYEVGVNGVKSICTVDQLGETWLYVCLDDETFTIHNITKMSYLQAWTENVRDLALGFEYCDELDSVTFRLSGKVIKVGENGISKILAHSPFWDRYPTTLCIMDDGSKVLYYRDEYAPGEEETDHGPNAAGILRRCVEGLRRD